MVRKRLVLGSITVLLVLLGLWVGSQFHLGRPTPADHPLPQFSPRSGHWNKTRIDYLKEHQSCAACGSSHDPQIHHVKPFHLHPELELDPRNLINLCGPGGCYAHFHIGHLGDWHKANPDVREDAARLLRLHRRTSE